MVSYECIFNVVLSLVKTIELLILLTEIFKIISKYFILHNKSLFKKLIIYVQEVLF